MKLNSILLIDDDDATNFLNSLIIKEAEIAENILIALNGEEALTILQNNVINNNPQPELILLDINMPNMNGWEFIKEYKKDNVLKNSKSLIIMLSTSFNPEDEIKALQIPEIKSFKNKPLTLDMLNEVLNF